MMTVAMPGSVVISPPAVYRPVLDSWIANGPEHFRGVMRCMRDHDCDYLMVVQDAPAFAPPDPGRPTFVIVGDDLLTAKGPAAFDRRSLKRAIACCDAAFIIASAPEARTYDLACIGPRQRRASVIIVETQPEHEKSWVDLIEQARPGIKLTISKADPLLRPDTQPWGRA